MSNREMFKETFEQVELSQLNLQKLKDLEGKHMKKTIWKFAVMAASLAIVFLVSNTIFYATTGDTIIDEVRQFLDLKKEHIRINNDVVCEELVRSYRGKDGLTYYEYSDGSKMGITLDDPKHNSIFDYEIPIEGGFASGLIVFEGALYEEDDRIYLKLHGDPIDITEDFEDGLATGSFVYTDIYYDMSENFEYRVEGTLVDYTVDVWWVESE